MEEKFQIELKKNREAWLASEKVRKEKWEKEKIMEIKGQTLKGLEPEIESLVIKGKENVRKVEEKFRQELRN